MDKRNEMGRMGMKKMDWKKLLFDVIKVVGGAVAVWLGNG